MAENKEQNGHSHAEGDISKCPFHNGSMDKLAGGAGTKNKDWWPETINLNILRQHSNLSNPFGDDFSYADEFSKLDLAAVKKDTPPILVI